MRLHVVNELRESIAATLKHTSATEPASNQRSASDVGSSQETWTAFLTATPVATTAICKGMCA